MSDTDSTGTGTDAESSTSSTPPTQGDSTTESGTPPAADTSASTDDGAADGDSVDENADTFPRSYVERLRRENANYREQASNATRFAQRLHTELVRATGRLADPTDLPYDAEHLEDAATLGNAIDDLLARKPHLASRRPVGDIGQGANGNGSPVDLAGLLRARA
jgi:hypothetical protein